jgi:GTPase SAR1 family protein
MSSINCPYCWESSRVNRLARRCPEDCGEGPDPELTRFLGREHLRPVIAPLAYEPAAAKGQDLCPHGRTAPRGRICPHCHNDLEYDYIATASRSRPIALIGASGSGKSVYVGVLVRELRTRIGTQFNGMSVEFVGDSSRTYYDEIFWVPLFKEGVTLGMTASLRVSRRLTPLLFSLRFPGRHRGGNRAALAMMVFLDTSGEDVLKATAMDRLARYLRAAAGVILVVDPLQMPDVRGAVHTTVYPAGATNQIAVLERLAALLREERGRSAEKPLDKPLAIVLSKIDAIDETLGDQSMLHRQGQHAGHYDEADGRLVHDEVRAWIHRWYGEGFVNTVERNFARNRYFGMSALGTAPPREGRLDPSGIRPRRVEDPLLWLLGQFGLMRSEARR